MKKTFILFILAIATISLVVGCSSEIKSYTVTFDSNGGTGTAPSQSVAEGKKATKPTEIPAHVGWGLLGWSTVKDDATTAFDFDKESITSDITLYAMWKTTDYSIGDTGPAGGLIFYDCDADNNDGQNDGAGADNLKSSVCGWRYLEAGMSDLGNGITYTWGPYNEKVSGTKTGIGEGKNNTEIVSNKGESYAAANVACGDNYNNGYDDWFLPSKDELNLMYVNLKKKGIGNFKDATYWSSSEGSINDAWGQVFDDGCQYGYSRGNIEYVRPIRRF